MLLTFDVEKKPVNGSVGFIHRGVYSIRDGPRVPGSHPVYVVVDFPDSEMIVA
jgi:hypothetical protein